MKRQQVSKTRRAYGKKQDRVATNMINLEKCSIPTFISDTVYSTTMRWIVAEASADVVSVTVELPLPPWALASSSTLLNIPFKAVRLSKIEMWCVYRNSQSISGNTINLTYLERRGVRPIEYSDTASYQANAHIKRKFRKDDPCGWYYNTTIGESNPEFVFRLPKGAVLEMSFDYILDDGDAVLTNSTSGLTAQTIYSNRLSTSLDCVGKTNQFVLVY